MVAGRGFEPPDLRVMSPTSYQAALPRDILQEPFSCVHIIISQQKAFVNPFFEEILRFFRFIYLFFATIALLGTKFALSSPLTYRFRQLKKSMHKPLHPRAK